MGLILEELIRLSHQRRHSRKQAGVLEDRLKPSGARLDLLAFAGLEIIPVVYVLLAYKFPTWLSFANLQSPRWVHWSGVLLLVAGLALLWRAHQDLGRQWSASLAIQLEHRLIRRGVYHYIRHPIYAALWLTALAQFCLLSNWLAGSAGVICFLPLYLVRVPQEEQSLLAHFGETYQVYMQQTGRLLPRFGR